MKQDSTRPHILVANPPSRRYAAEMFLLRCALPLLCAALCRAQAEPGSLEGDVGNQGRTPHLEQESYATRAAEGVIGPRLTHVRALARELRVYLMIGSAE